MRRLLNKLDKNLLLKVAGFNSVYVLLRIAIGAMMSFILARFVGAAGMAAMGNLRDFTRGLWTFSVLGLDNGLVKNAAQFQSDKAALKNVFNTAWSLCLIVSLVLGIACFVGATQLDELLINREVDFSIVFQLLGISLPFHVLFVMLTSLFQGMEWYKKFIYINITVSILVFIISAGLIYNFNLTGALYGIVLVPIIQTIVVFVLWGRMKVQLISLRELLQIKYDRKTASRLLNYSIMALVSALLIPAVQIIVRTKVMVEVSDEAAGYWEAVLRISGYYMLFVTTLVSLYVLPSLSKDESSYNYRATIWHFYKNILPLVIAGLIAIFLCRELIIQFLLTKEFEAAGPLFKWQLLGDFVKVITTVLAFRFIALNDLKRYLIAEVLSILSFLVFSYVLIPKYQEEGVVIAYLLNYLFYLIVLLVLLRKELFYKTQITSGDY